MGTPLDAATGIEARVQAMIATLHTKPVSSQPLSPSNDCLGSCDRPTSQASDVAKDAPSLSPAADPRGALDDALDATSPVSSMTPPIVQYECPQRIADAEAEEVQQDCAVDAG